MTVELDATKLNLAARRAEALASAIRREAGAARRSSPIHLPSLDGIEKTADDLEKRALLLVGLADLAVLIDASGKVDAGIEKAGSALEEVLGSYLTAKFNSNYGLGDNTDFPWIEVAMGLANMRSVSQGVAPVFQAGLIGKPLLKIMARAGGPSARFAEWMVAGGGKRQALPKTLPKALQNAFPKLLGPPDWVGPRTSYPTGAWADPLAKGAKGGLAAFRAFGVAGGVLSTANAATNLYQQGHPKDAFKREGAGYVADVAETAFSASSTAFLVAPNPVTATLAVGSGVVWAGAEIVDNWDDITDTASKVSEKASKAWDKVTPW